MEMKKILLATALSLCVSSAFAANPTAVLQVKGTLTNAACTPVLSNGGIVDYGTIRMGDLSSTAVNQLGQKNIDLTINCTAATMVSYNMVDDRASSNANLTVENATFTGDPISGPTQTYGVGTTSGASPVNIGSFGMFTNLTSVTADGVAADAIYQNFYPAGSWVKSTAGSSQGQSIRDFTVASPGTLTPLAFLTATFPLTVSLAIQDTTTLALTDDTQLDGQLTISLRYL